MTKCVPVLGVLLLGLLPLGLIGQEPELTAEQQKLLKEAKALNSEGVRLYRQGKLPEATERLRKALELRQQVYSKDKFPNGHSDLVASVNNLAALLHAQGESGQAEPLYRQALAITEALYPKDRYPDGHADLTPCLNNLAFLVRDQGDHGQAEALFRRALEINEALYPREKYRDGHPDLALSLNNLAALLQAQASYAKAEPLYRRALEINEALYPREKYPNGHPDLAFSLNNLGYVLDGQREYDKAEPLYRRALEMYERLFPKDKYPDGTPELAVCTSNLAGLLGRKKDYPKAEDLYRRALAMQEAWYSKDRFPRGHPDLARGIQNLAALLHTQEEHARAEPLYRRAREMYEAIYPKGQFPNGHRDLAVCISFQAAMLFFQGEYDKAQPLFRRALEMNEALYPEDQFPNGHPELIHGISDLAALALARREHGEAEALFRRALKLQGRQVEQTALTASEAVALNFATTFPMTRDGLLSATRDRHETDRQTYQAVWHSKAAITRVFQRRHLALIAAATDPDVRKEWDQLQALRRRREQLIMAPSAGPSQRDGRGEKIEGLGKAIGELEQSLLPRLPALKHYEDLAKQDPEALRKLLPEDAVLVDVLRYTHFEQDPKVPGHKGETRTPRFLAFVVSRKEIRRVELEAAPGKETAADIDAAVKDWREAITLELPGGNDTARQDHDAKLLRLGRRLRELVWEPVRKHLPAGAKAVFLAPDGDLTQVPWAALPGQDKDQVLLDEYALAVVPHGPFLLEQLTPPPPRSEKRPAPGQGLLLVGGVKYDDKPGKPADTREAEAVVGPKVNWRYLDGTEKERQLIEKVLAGSGVKLTANLNGTDAATDRLRKELERVRYAHLGTHGFFADKEFRSVLQLDPKLFERRLSTEGHILHRGGEAARSPLVLSGLVCAGANLDDTPDRGILSADAIAGLLLDDLHLAVLSACDTGLGDVAGGEGVFGLQRAFHVAGCRNVVASLWKVDDAATAALMTRFYSYLFAEDKDKRLPPIEALRRAQLDLYRQPEMIPNWSKGERSPGKPRPATTAPPPETPQELLTSEGRAPIKLWAAFTLSGLGR